MSFSENVEVLSVVSEPELAVEAEEVHILTLVFDLHVVWVGVVPEVQNVETEPVDERLLLP